jgi:hypothetical protein
MSAAAPAKIVGDEDVAAPTGGRAFRTHTTLRRRGDVPSPNTPALTTKCRFNHDNAR